MIDKGNGNDNLYDLCMSNDHSFIIHEPWWAVFIFRHSWNLWRATFLWYQANSEHGVMFITLLTHRDVTTKPINSPAFICQRVVVVT